MYVFCVHIYIHIYGFFATHTLGHIYITYIYNFSNSFLDTVRILRVHHMHHDVPKCMSCHKAIVMITGGWTLCFPEYTCVNPILLL